MRVSALTKSTQPLLQNLDMPLQPISQRLVHKRRPYDCPPGPRGVGQSFQRITSVLVDADLQRYDPVANRSVGGEGMCQEIHYNLFLRPRALT